jgi:hypothetical protein
MQKLCCAGKADTAVASAAGRSSQQPEEAHRGPRLVSEIHCSPLRVLTGQGPDINRLRSA